MPQTNLNRRRLSLLKQIKNIEMSLKWSHVHLPPNVRNRYVKFLMKNRKNVKNMLSELNLLSIKVPKR